MCVGELLRAPAGRLEKELRSVRAGRFCPMGLLTASGCRGCLLTGQQAGGRS